MTLDDDVAAAVEQVRRADGIGMSEAVSRLARRGMSHPEPPQPYRHRTTPLGIGVDVANVAAVLELLDLP